MKATAGPARMTLDQFLDRFSHVRANGKGYRAECPGHASASKQSLSIRPDGDTILIHDFGGCATADVLAKVGLTLADLYLDGSPSPNGHRPRNGRVKTPPIMEGGPRCPTCGSLYTWLPDSLEVVCVKNRHGAPADLEPEIAEWHRERNRQMMLAALDRKIGPPDGAELLDAVYAFLGRFVAYPSEHARVAHALWVEHAHLMDAWECTPRLAFLSPEPASGKTRALEITELLVPRPVEAVNVTPAYLFRKIADEDGRPTVLFDEIDTVFGPKAREHEEIRGLLNAGHRVGAVAGRCVVRGKQIVTEEIPAYSAVALAGLGGLPDTILSRSVIVRMRRRAPGEHVEPYRRRMHAPEGHALRDRIATWAEAVAARAADHEPAMPAGIEDRDADLWEPLLTVADLAGGEWPERARVAAVALVALSKAGTPSLGIRLLADLRTVFGDADALATETILERLHKLDEAPWAELVAGKPLNARGLAHRLRDYGVSSKTVRIGEKTPKGYAREDLADAWARYLPPSPQESATSATSATSADDGTANLSDTGEGRGARPPGDGVGEEMPDPALCARCAVAPALPTSRLCGACVSAVVRDAP
jgi:hypothetical protein